FRHWHMPEASESDVQAFLAHVRSTWGDPALRDAAQLRQTVKEIALEAQKTLGVRSSFVVLEFICGACNALDERSAFLPPSEEYTTHLGQLNSLGMLVASTADNDLFVEKVASGSWAAQVGLKDGDRIFLHSNPDEKGEIGPLVDIEVLPRGESM